jgi:hypothetical protein
MNNKFEILAKLIVPAFFLIVWALNQIFNKETPATPARGNRPVGPPGGGRPPGPPQPPKQREEDRAFAAADPKSGVWTSSASSPRDNSPVVIAGDDEIVILSSETVRRPPPAKARTQSSSSANRPRPNRRPRPPGPDGDTPQRLGGNISQSVRQTIERTPLDMKAITQSPPLNVSTDLRSSHGSATMLSSTASIAGSAGPAAELFDLQGAIRDRSRLREAFLLNELIQPPLALRNRTFPQKSGAVHR